MYNKYGKGGGSARRAARPGRCYWANKSQYDMLMRDNARDVMRLCWCDVLLLLVIFHQATVFYVSAGLTYCN